MRAGYLCLLTASLSWVSLQAAGNTENLPEYPKHDPLVRQGRQGNTSSSCDLAATFKTGYIYSHHQNNQELSDKQTHTSDKNHFWGFSGGASGELTRGSLRGLSVDMMGKAAWSMGNTRHFNAPHVTFREDNRSGNGSRLLGGRADLGWNLTRMTDAESSTVIRPHAGYAYDYLKASQKTFKRNGHKHTHASKLHWHGPYVGLQVEGHFESSHAYGLLGRVYFATTSRVKSSFETTTSKNGWGWEIEGQYKYHLASAWDLCASITYRRMKSTGSEKHKWQTLSPMLGLHVQF